MNLHDTIWKYEVPIEGEVTLLMPEGARILSIQDTYPDKIGRPLTLWALVNPMNPPTQRTLSIFGTGHPVGDSPGVYIATVVTSGGGLVWHIFEEGSV